MCNIGLSLQGIDSEKQKEILRPMGWVAASIYATVTFATWSSRSLSAADGVTAVVSPDYSVVSCGGRLGSGGFTVTCGGAFAAFFDFDFFDDGRF